MKRRLFCEISPITYKISITKEIFKRNIRNMFCGLKFATDITNEKLPVLVYRHNSLIRRKLNNVDLQLQENKAVNLTLTTPKVNGVMIKPGQTFSFWNLVGNCTKEKGYKEGLTISNGKINRGIAGGMCQFTNLLHWMVLHTPLEVIEYHHHNGIDMFPDFGRQVPFGTGTSICYNSLDYMFTNNTDVTFQIICYVTETHLCGEIRANKEIKNSYHVYEEDAYFEKREGTYYRHNKIYRKCIDKKTGNTIENKLLQENNSKVMYDEKFINKEKIRS